MGIFAALAGVMLIVAILIDSFETTVLPRRVTHRFRFARFFYITAWKGWRIVGLRLSEGKTREAFFGGFGPLSTLGLLTAWVIGLISGFAVIHWSLDLPVQTPDAETTFGTYFYMSGITFFTLGFGDVVPLSPLGRALAVIEGGMGFGFLAIIIGYMPVFYQVYAQREVLIAILDARAGSPPSASQLLLRQARAGSMASIDSFLGEWERWAAELLESHLSFPVLAMYRSQHENQSWLAALTAILDTCAFLIVAVKQGNPYQAQLTFAMARHAAVDLALIFKSPPVPPQEDRLSAPALAHLREQLKKAGLLLHEGPAVDAKLNELRGMYEPFVNALAQRLLFGLPSFVPMTESADNWQRSAWMKRVPEIGSLPMVSTGDGHFD